MLKAKKKSDFIFKYILVGDTNVGKTAISYRFREDKFVGQYAVTVNCEYNSHSLDVNGKTITFELWDTAGGDQFNSLSKGYYQNSVCALVVYDITSRKTFDNVKEWIKQCKKYGA